MNHQPLRKETPMHKLGNLVVIGLAVIGAAKLQESYQDYRRDVKLDAQLKDLNKVDASTNVTR